METLNNYLLTQSISLYLWLYPLINKFTLFMVAMGIICALIFIYMASKAPIVDFEELERNFDDYGNV